MGLQVLLSHHGKGPLLVHCKSGKGRSATVAAAYIAHIQGLTADEALDQLHSKRNAVILNAAQRNALHHWHDTYEAHRQ